MLKRKAIENHRRPSMKRALTRKQFLTSVATGLAGAALPGALLKAATNPRATPETVAASTTRDRFTSAVGTAFLAHPAGRDPVALTLLAVDKLKSSSGTIQFSLRFAAPGGESLPEGTHDIEHATLGSLQMFLVATGSDGKGQTLFRADFNLIDARSQKSR
jgi:uncharacterized protein DUF6916